MNHCLLVLLLIISAQLAMLQRCNAQCNPATLTPFFNGSIIGVRVVTLDQDGNVAVFQGNSKGTSNFFFSVINNVNSFNVITSTLQSCGSNGLLQPFDVNQVVLPFENSQAFTISNQAVVTLTINQQRTIIRLSFCSSAVAFGSDSNNILYSFYFTFSPYGQIQQTCTPGNTTTTTTTTGPSTTAVAPTTSTTGSSTSTTTSTSTTGSPTTSTTSTTSSPTTSTTSTTGSTTSTTSSTSSTSSTSTTGTPATSSTSTTSTTSPTSTSTSTTSTTSSPFTTLTTLTTITPTSTSTTSTSTSTTSSPPTTTTTSTSTTTTSPSTTTTSSTTSSTVPNLAFVLNQTNSWYLGDQKYYLIDGKMTNIGTSSVKDLKLSCPTPIRDSASVWGLVVVSPGVYTLPNYQSTLGAGETLDFGLVTIGDPHPSFKAM
ncbi:hypothetical protein SAMD00019534_020370 [Acytostelium subglobosum LB1]|uniref:hypothetical protein n=1 Tax=Acytostelium subglobosum LB1 TaxID=1410327 RepID=UPI000644C814|nr:hypothetical protein SAMD00019534_020370 [Acytostelium subglobosum LB1]GAM18862.1 hypothetical protein SAMD00019534_020370 [Acytostelium subglobosum LB1]|eukprot:XP_012758082.1 hypothetical protein SAMD00019534_020370 [Acytostelium subglobosum LB1]